MTDPLARLIGELSRLPSIGPKTATRLAHYLLKVSPGEAQNLAQVAMKLGQAIYEKQAAAEASPGADGAAAGPEAGGEEVVDAEFSEVDDNKA